MSSNKPQADIDPLAYDLIRRKARSLVRRGGLSRTERDDVEQDLILCFLQRRSLFDPAKGSYGRFVSTVLKGCAANILRARCAAKRDPRRTRSLQGRVRGEGGASTELGENISQQERDAKRGLVAGSAEEDVQRQLDVAAVLAALPAELRDLALRLMTSTITKVAQELGVRRTTLYTPVRKLRRHFENAGLRPFL
jgi:DNA-directed RNA polymerase specialized sigma24 family protein